MSSYIKNKSRKSILPYIIFIFSVLVWNVGIQVRIPWRSFVKKYLPVLFFPSPYVFSLHKLKIITTCKAVDNKILSIWRKKLFDVFLEPWTHKSLAVHSSFFFLYTFLYCTVHYYIYSYIIHLPHLAAVVHLYL